MFPLWFRSSFFPPQVPRSGDEQQRFSKALGSLDVVYGHKETMVWMQTRMPVTPVLPGYDKSGWCCFESSVCSLQKHADRRLDLGRYDSRIEDFKGMLRSSKASRAPPLDPHSFSEELEKRSFTGRGDKETVKGLYAKVFATMTGSAKELSFGSLKWGDEEATALALVRVRERSITQVSINCNFLIGCVLDSNSSCICHDCHVFSRVVFQFRFVFLLGVEDSEVVQDISR